MTVVIRPLTITTCACGCGRRVIANRYGRPRVYAGAACRQRAHRQRADAFKVI